MPKVNTRRNSDGTTTHFVRFRLDGIQTSLPFGDDLREAERFATDVENRGAQWAWENYQRAEEIAAEMTLDEWATRYFGALTISPGSIDEYRRQWRLRWKPHLGHMKLSRITREDVVAAVKAQSGLAPRTIENAWGTLATMLKVAVADGHIDRSPALGVKLPKHEGHESAEHRYMDADELLQVIADTRDRYKPLMWMLVGTGMRWSEATALTVGDVDLEAKTVRVTKAWKRDREKGSWYVGQPKTRKSKRTISLPNETVEAVRPLVEGRKRAERLFTNQRGEWIKHQTFYREHWREHCTKNVAKPRPRIHDIRHSHVALLIAAGTSLPVIQARLGHEKITTTIDTYGHLLPDLQVAAAAAADAVLSRGTKPKEIG
jgi:integrase